MGTRPFQLGSLGCAALALGLAHATPAAAVEISFEGVGLPANAEAKLGSLATGRVTVGGQSRAVGFMPLIRPGDVLGGVVFGQVLDPSGQPMMDKDGRPQVCNRPDFMSILPVGGKLFMLNQFECAPAAFYLTELAQDAASGAIRAVATRPVDLGPVGGGLRHCAGMITPWNTHLASEEALIDAAAIAPDGSGGDANWKAMSAWIGKGKANPYLWGWAPEVAVLDASGTTRVSRRYALGRLALEMAYVLPDERTVFLSEDNANSPLAIFVADRPRDLSAGRLYAARITQTSSEGAGAGELSWIDLGHAGEAEIGALVTGGTRFEQIFRKAPPLADGSCPAGLTSINAQFKQECVALVPGMEKAASRLETGRYAALKGATTELRKMEGVSFDPERNRLYVAMSRIERGLLDKDKSWDAGGRNDLRLAANPCGAIYALDTAGGVKDDQGQPIDSRLVPTRMTTLIVGKPARSTDPNLSANTCDVEGISEPDNLTYLPGSDTLVIAEDSGGHETNMVWALNVASGKLTRLQTLPIGAEATGTYWYASLGGFGYLSSVIQHPLIDPKEVPEAVRGRVTAELQRSTVGLIGPLPALGR